MVTLPYAVHHTLACPHHLVCVVGALSRFLTSVAINEHRKNSSFSRLSTRQNDLDKFQVFVYTAGASSPSTAGMSHVLCLCTRTPAPAWASSVEVNILHKGTIHVHALAILLASIDHRRER